jgi:hypothetical protein
MSPRIHNYFLGSCWMSGSVSVHFAFIDRTGALSARKAISREIRLPSDCTVRSDRMFCERLDYNLLFRWFLDMNWDEPGFDHSPLRATGRCCLSTTWRGSFFARWLSRRADIFDDLTPSFPIR